MKIPIFSDWLEKRSTLQNPSQWMTDLFSAGPSATGKSVNPHTAMQSTAVYSCVRVLAETVASLPLHLYRRTDQGKMKASDHVMYNLLHNEPNPEMTSFTFREMMMHHICLWGNCYAEKEMSVGGRVKALWPLLPDRVVVERLPSGRKVYRITDLGVELNEDQVLHIPGFGFDGLKGKSPISMTREAIGLSLAAEEYGATYFGNGAKPGGVLEHPGKLKDEGVKKLRDSWNEMHKGLTNQHRIAILEEGMKYQQIGLPPGDSQFIETRKFQINEIARIFRVPPHMIGDLERSTNNNIEHQSIEFVVHTIRPYLVRFEQAMNKELFFKSEKNKYFAEFVVDGLLRGDIQSRYNAYAVARQWGWYSVNDIRELENQNQIENGDVYLQPMNMVEAGSIIPNSEPDPPELEEERCSCCHDHSEPEKENRKDVNEKEERAMRSAAERFRLTNSYESTFKNSASRFVRFEARKVKEKAKEMLTERGSEAFQAWLERFYREELPAEIRKNILPSFRSFAVLIYSEAAKEMQMAPDGTRDIEEFIPKYLDGFIRRYTESSKGQLRALLSDLDGDYDIIEDRLDEWSERRADKVADNETTRLAGAVSKLAYAAAGATMLRWVNTSGKPCPYCEEMDNKTIGINSTFVEGGTSFEPNGAKPLRISTNVGHPPLHQGCHCQVVAE